MIFSRPIAAITAVLISSTLSAQLREIRGTVRDEQGFALPFVSVVSAGSKSGVSTDSAGRFRINVQPTTRLLFSGTGFLDTLITPSADRVDVVMTSSSNRLKDVVIGRPTEASATPLTPFSHAPEAAYEISAVQTLRDFLATERIQSFDKSPFLRRPGDGLYHGSAVPEFHHQAETHGSRYLNEEWSSGEAINTRNEVVKSDKLRFNYDKVGKKLLVTEDLETMIEVDANGISAFSIYGKPEYVFERVPAIGPDFLVKLVSSKAGYSLYKSISTRYEKANYHSDGLVESGKDYNEYVDSYEYYIVLPGNAKFIRIEPRINQLKEIFPNNAAAAVFIKQHRYDTIDEAFLVGLTTSLN